MLEPSLFGIEDALTGGGIVGGIVTTVGALYVIWDKYKRAEFHRSAKKELNDAAIEAKRVVTDAAKIKNEEEEIRVGELARRAVSEAYKEALAQQKSNHDKDMRAVRAELKTVVLRVSSVEDREAKCQQDMNVLRLQNQDQEKKINTQEMEFSRLREEGTALRTEVSSLKKQLRDSGTIDGSDTGNHKPL